MFSHVTNGWILKVTHLGCSTVEPATMDDPARMVDSVRILPEWLMLPDPAVWLILQICCSSEVQSRCKRSVACIGSDSMRGSSMTNEGRF